MIIKNVSFENGEWVLAGPCGERLSLAGASNAGPFEVGLLGTRTAKKVSAKTRRLAEMIDDLQRPIYILDVRRAGVGGQGSWSPLEFASVVPETVREPYSFFHLPSLAPTLKLLQDYRKSRKLPNLTDTDIAGAVSAVGCGDDPGAAAWKHWQVFREKYRKEIQSDPHSTAAAVAFVEVAQAAGGLAIFVCAEEFEEDFDCQSQDRQDEVYCHRYTLAAAVSRSLRQRYPGCEVTRVDLSLEFPGQHSHEYPTSVSDNAN
jgi:hypothetical protein